MNSRVHPKYKTRYRVTNWASYGQALVQRGSITVWLSLDAIVAWKPKRDWRRGGQLKYSDLAIETALTLRLVFHLPLRQAEGFLASIFNLMALTSMCLTTRHSRGVASTSISNVPASLLRSPSISSSTAQDSRS